MRISSSASRGDAGLGDRDAEAAADHEVLLLERDGALERVDDALGRVGRRLGIFDVLEQDRELVTAEARRGVGGADRGRDPLRDLEQQLVAGRVAEAVVDSFEVVEVEEDDGEAELLAARAGHRVAYALVEQGAVGQVGDRVVEGLMGELLLKRLALADVAAVEHDAPHRAVLEQVVVQDLEVADAAVLVGEQAFDRLRTAADSAAFPETQEQAHAVARMQHPLKRLPDELLGGEPEHLLDRRALVDDPHIGVEHRDEVTRVLNQGGEARLAGAPVDLFAEADTLECESDLVGQGRQCLARVRGRRAGAGDHEQHARVAVGLVELEDERLTEQLGEAQRHAQWIRELELTPGEQRCAELTIGRPGIEFVRLVGEPAHGHGISVDPAHADRHVLACDVTGRTQRGERDVATRGGSDEHRPG